MGLYRALSLVPADTHVVLPRIEPRKETPISLDSPALCLFTDLFKTKAITIRASTQIDLALEHMIQTGVRLLFVEDDSDRLVGLITSYDIVGEKPMVYVQQHDGHLSAITRSHVVVENIMQPVKKWNVLDFSIVERASLADIVETFKKTGQKHLVVLERTLTAVTPIVRGLFSATQIERELRLMLGSNEPAPLNTFAEIEHALAH